MPNFVHDGDALDYTPSAAVAAGSVVILGDIVGIAPRDIPANTLGAIQVKGVFDFPKASGTNFVAGAKVYFAAGSGLATATTSDKFCGHAVAAAISGTTSVRVLLDRLN